MLDQRDETFEIGCKSSEALRWTIASKIESPISKF
jgi:hypothetical protein